MSNKKVNSQKLRSFSQNNNSKLEREKQLNQKLNSELLTINVFDQTWSNANLQVNQLTDGTPIVFADTKEKWEECLVLIDQIIRHQPYEAYMHMGRGLILNKLNYKETACNSWRRAFELGNTESHSYLQQYCE